MIGAIIGGAVGALGGLLGSKGKNDSIRKQMELLQRQQKENPDYFDRRYNEDATQRADAQRILQITEDRLRKRNKAAAGREAVMGGATEDTMHEKEAGNEMMANAVSQINAAGEQRKEQIEQQYRQQKNTLAQQEMALKGQELSDSDILSNVAGGAFGGVASGLMMEGMLKGGGSAAKM